MLFTVYGGKMDGVNKTLYIPLYGKAYVSKKGVILSDIKAEKIWAKEGFELKGRSKSKWLAYYMGMRSAVFDRWLKIKMKKMPGAIVIHIGCGMDSRVERVGCAGHEWYDVDFPEVIKERKKYYSESGSYHMIESDARNDKWIYKLPENKKAIVVMEGVSMYFKPDELTKLLKALKNHFNGVSVLMDCYSTFAAKASKFKNPINDVGVTVVYGIDDPRLLGEKSGLEFISQHKMLPEKLLRELKGSEGIIFRMLYGGSIAKNLYKIYEFEG